MGLHGDVKKYLLERFPGCVDNAPPPIDCQVLVCDYMWLLFKFTPDEGTAGEELIDFVWGPISRFFEAGGETYVMCFDRPERVPRAKAEEHARRYGGGVPVPLTSTECDYENLPFPWYAALANREVRKRVCVFIADSVLRRFSSSNFSRSATLFVHGIGDSVRKATVGCVSDAHEHSIARDIGEGDLAVAYWAAQYADKTVVARVLDSDQIPILMLCARTARRTRGLYVWLVSPGRDESSPENYRFLPVEKRTVIDVLGMNRALKNEGVSVFEFVFMIICQKTDFVNKIIKNLGVAPSMRSLEIHFKGAIRVSASAARCDSDEIKKCFRRTVSHSGRKRAEVSECFDVELRRAWWNLLYWTFGTAGALPQALAPSRAFGFDDAGFRPAEKSLDLDYPFYSP
jgi:hypothetical protein